MEWFKTWFNTPYYHILYKDRDYEEGERFLEKLIDALDLKKGKTIIDLACGKGRHSIFLNKLGYKVLGLDLSEESIAYDKQFENEDLHFAVHDIRNPIKGGKVDAVFNLFTSFGYFITEEEDQAVFTSVADSLVEDGIFVLDFMNADYVKSNLVTEEKITKDNIDFTIKKRIENKHILKDIIFTDKGEDYNYQENVKLHDLDSIESFAKNVGLERIHVYGDYNLNSFQLETSPRCINIFRKIAK